MTKKIKNKNIKDLGTMKLTPDQEEQFAREEEAAEKFIEEHNFAAKTGDIHLRVAISDIARAKTLAAKKGLKYQTFLKMIIKEGLDHYEKHAG